MNDNRAMPARLSAFVIWALVAVGLVFWGYRLLVRPLALPVNVQAVAESPGATGDLARMLGAAPAPQAATPTPVAESSRFKLFGVLAPVAAAGVTKQTTAGVALIAVDGKPARAYAVGAQLGGNTVLQSISRRSASLGPEQGATTVVLELPTPPLPATGTLPMAVAGGEPAPGLAPTQVPPALATPPSLAAVPPTTAAAPPTLQPAAPTQLQAPPAPQMAPQAHPADEPVQGEEPGTSRRRRGPTPASL
jgi:general secretion pathway protein C